MSPTRPYSSQSCPSSNSAEMSSVCSLEQGGYLLPSRSSTGAVDLNKGHQHQVNRYINKDLLWAPILDHTGQCCLFRIVSYIWAKPIHSLTEVVISTANNFGSSHSQFKRLKHFCKGRMQQLVLKLAECWIIFVGIVIYR